MGKQVQPSPSGQYFEWVAKAPFESKIEQEQLCGGVQSPELATPADNDNTPAAMQTAAAPPRRPTPPIIRWPRSHTIASLSATGHCDISPDPFHNTASARANIPPSITPSTPTELMIDLSKDIKKGAPLGAPDLLHVKVLTGNRP